MPSNHLTGSRQFPEVIPLQALSDPIVHKTRVLDDTRDSGYRDWDSALAWNQRTVERQHLPGEQRIDTTYMSASETADQILTLLGGGES